MFTQESERVCSCNIKCCDDAKGLIKVIGSHVCCKSGNISETANVRCESEKGSTIFLSELCQMLTECWNSFTSDSKLSQNIDHTLNVLQHDLVKYLCSKNHSSRTEWSNWSTQPVESCWKYLSSGVMNSLTTIFTVAVLKIPQNNWLYAPAKNKTVHQNTFAHDNGRLVTAIVTDFVNLSVDESKLPRRTGHVRQSTFLPVGRIVANTVHRLLKFFHPHTQQYNCGQVIAE